MATSQTEQTSEDVDTDPTGRSGWWIFASLLVIAIPVLVGFLLLRSNDESPGVAAVAPAADGSVSAAGGMGDGMGGAAGVADTVGDTILPAGVQPLADIQASDIVIEPDPFGAGAVLRLTTSLDVACAVSYGPTAELGMIATDSDMAGGGHTDHHPVLPGLITDVSYFYQVSAIGPDGGLYQSSIMQFTYEGVPGDVETVAPPAPNVAGLARVSDASSQYSDAYAANYAIDGDPATEWSTAGDGDNAYIVLEFGEEMQIAGVGFRTRSMTDGTSITTSFTVVVDGKSYGPFNAGPGLSVGLLDAVGTKVRIEVETSTGGNTGAIEIEVYGQTDM